MKPHILLALVLSLVVGGALQACGGGPSPAPVPANVPATREEPTLAVLVVADQLRADLVVRYQDLFEGGFRRLLDEGYQFTQASHAHAGTFTAPGHATLSTGVYPSRHGIVSNDWSEETPEGWVTRYNILDADSPILGQPDLDGRSPRDLLRDGLADWIVEHNPEARVLSVATKDRSAVLMAAKTQGEVYWNESVAGGFVTSSYYRNAYPDWVERFNRTSMPGIYGDPVWESSVPASAEGRSRPDANAYENDGEHTTFPHDAREEVREIDTFRFREWVRNNTPRLDEATLGLALAGLEEMGLGRRGGLDYLAVGFSQPDYVGHRFGPLSREQLDEVLRLDRLLGTLMTALDEQVGEGRWVLALSADHGVVDLPEWREEQGLSGGRVSRDDLRALREELRGELDSGDPDEAGDRMARYARELPFVEAVYSQDALVRGELADSFAVLYRNSYHDGRVYGLLGRVGLDVRLTEGWISDGSARGTTHGSPYWYDRHVPLFFLGAGVRAGRSDEPAYTVDVAPTLASLAGVAPPDDVDGRLLLR